MCIDITRLLVLPIDVRDVIRMGLDENYNAPSVRRIYFLVLPILIFIIISGNYNFFHIF